VAEGRPTGVCLRLRMCAGGLACCGLAANGVASEGWNHIQYEQRQAEPDRDKFPLHDPTTFLIGDYADSARVDQFRLGPGELEVDDVGRSYGADELQAVDVVAQAVEFESSRRL
jgi:hypothetical protein